MRITLRDLADARRELVEVQQEFVRLQRRIDEIRECVTLSLTRIFGEDRPAIAALAEEEFIEKLAGRVAARLGTQPTAKRDISNYYVREKGAAAFLGVSVFSLRSWRCRGTGDVPPWAKVSGMVMYSKKALEEYMEMRTVERWL